MKGADLILEAVGLSSNFPLFAAGGEFEFVSNPTKEWEWFAAHLPGGNCFLPRNSHAQKG